MGPFSQRKRKYFHTEEEAALAVDERLVADGREKVNFCEEPKVPRDRGGKLLRYLSG